MFSEEKKVRVWDRNEWWQDTWNPLDYGREYDFNKTFFAQFLSLFLSVPLPSRWATDVINSDYCMNCAHLKNCYLVFYSNYDENCCHGIGLNDCKDCLDNAYLTKGELCYESFKLERCSRLFFSSNCEDCVDVYLSKDCIGCSDCFGCVNLRNKQFYIFNQPYSKEDYHRKLKEVNLGSYSDLSVTAIKAHEFWLSFPVPAGYIRHSSNVNGNYLYNSRDTLNSFFINGGENLKNCAFFLNPPIRDSYDYTIFGNNSELIYESTVVGEGSSKLKFCMGCWPNAIDFEYCIQCNSSSHLFGCVGLRSKEYCILNKQYSKEEYEKLIPRIIQHMNDMPYSDSQGRIYKYGEFFPPDLSPFAYNETIAQEYFPLTREEAERQGYKWREAEEKNYQITKEFKDLPNHIGDVDDSILKETIACAHNQECNEQCTKAFKIIPEELAFYRRMNLPLPRLCPNCRHYERLKQRNPLKLWHRKCMCGGKTSENGVYENTVSHSHGEGKCPNEFETSYSPERHEIVYCESCYQSEVV